MFSNVFCKMMREHGWFIQRIETGTTGKGVPDVYAVAPNGKAFWFELKRVHTIANTFDAIGIPWRPGQQAWLYNIVNNYKQKAFTVACCNNLIMLIGHDKLYEHNRVRIDDPSVRVYFKMIDLIQ